MASTGSPFGQAKKQLRYARSQGWIRDFSVINRRLHEPPELDGAQLAPSWQRFLVMLNDRTVHRYSVPQAAILIKGMRIGFALGAEKHGPTVRATLNLDEDELAEIARHLLTDGVSPEQYKQISDDMFVPVPGPNEVAGWVDPETSCDEDD